MSEIVSVEEARQILGKDADDMSDEQIREVVGTLRLLAKSSLEETQRKLLMRKNALALANLVYDIYRDTQS